MVRRSQLSQEIGARNIERVMGALIEVPLEGGGHIVVEMDHAGGGVVKAGRAGEVAARAAQNLESVLEVIAPTARAVLAKVREAGPQAVTVEFGVKLSAEVGAVITRTSGEGNFKVILHWEPRHGLDD